MELVTLSQRICGQADRALGTLIAGETNRLEEFCRGSDHGNTWGLTVTGDDEETKERRTIRVSWYTALAALRQGLFEIRAPEARQEAIDNFLRKTQAKTD